MALDSSVYDQYTLAGLNQAQGLLGKQSATYPTYTPKQAQSPAQASYYNYTPTAPIAQIQSPNYEVKAAPAQQWNTYTPNGLMAGDYDKYQQALTAPGFAAAQQAYDQGRVSLADTMGGRGLYGSSIMQNQQTNQLDKVFQQNVANNAANAAVQRYTMENQNINANNGLLATQNVQMNAFNQANRAQDIAQDDNANKFELQTYQFDQNQAKNTAALNFAANQDHNTYNMNKMNFDQNQAQKQIDWQNNNQYEQYLYGQAKNAYANQQDESMINRGLALAGYGNTGSTAANNYLMAQQQLAQQQQAASDTNTLGYVQGGVGAVGGLLNTDWFNNWMKS